MIIMNIVRLFLHFNKKMMKDLGKEEPYDLVKEGGWTLDALLSMKERSRFSKGLFGWVGFKTKWIEFENVERVAGETKWSFWKLFKYSIEGIMAFSTVPLMISLVLGIIFDILGFGFLLFFVISAAVSGFNPFNGGTIVSTVVFIGGIILTCMGILGLYTSKLYLEVKNRPIYIVKEEF